MSLSPINFVHSFSFFSSDWIISKDHSSGSVILLFGLAYKVLVSCQIQLAFFLVYILHNFLAIFARVDYSPFLETLSFLASGYTTFLGHALLALLFWSICQLFCSIPDYLEFFRPSYLTFSLNILFSLDFSY